MTAAPTFRITWLVVITAALTVLGVGIGDRLLTHWAYAVERGKIQANSDQLAEDDELAGVQQVANAFRMVSKVARPGVVHVQVGGIDEKWLRDRFGDGISDEEIQRYMRRFQDVPAGSGSGVIFDRDGRIVTNSHVVGDRPSVSVVLADDRTYDATVVGTDRKSDVALLKIEAPDLHPLKFGDSDKMEVGDWVLAVGAPFGLRQTVTHGIISATGRTYVPGVPIDYQDFLQTDAAINPGNSGGPLLNLRGEVIGLNTAIATHGDAFNAGVAFVIPSNMVVKIANELKEHGKVARGWLGINMSDLTEADRDIFGLKEIKGVLVNMVIKDTPAEKAGLTVEDVILEVNGTPINDRPHIRAIIADVKPGKYARFKIVRDGRLIEKRIRLARQAEYPTAALDKSVAFRKLLKLGFEARSLRPGLDRDLKHDLGYEPGDRGVLVGGITKRAAQRTGIASWDLIVACDGQPVASFYELTQALESADDEIELQVMDSSGKRRTVVIDNAR